MSDIIIDCFFNQLDCWKIRYAIPKPKIIRYQYPGESPVDVEGVRYTIENITPSGGENFGKWRLWDLQAWGEGWVSAYAQEYKYGQIVVRAGRKYGDGGFWQWDQAYIEGTLLSFEPFPQFVGESFVRGAGFVYTYKWRDVTGTIREGQVYASGSFQDMSNLFAGWWWQVAKSGPIIKAVWIPADGPLQEPLPQCRFKVFDINDNVIVDLTKNFCPAVTEFPCTNDGQMIKEITLKPEDRIVWLATNPVLKIVTTNIDGRVCKRIDLQYIGAGGTGSYTRTIAEICSPKGCNIPPYIEYKCDDDCNCQRCPDGTCFACLDGDSICCYGDSGTVIKRFPLKEKCKDQKIC